MPTTIRHKRSLRNVGESRTQKEAFLRAGYSESYANSGRVKYTDGWKELVEKEVPKEDLVKVLKDGLKADKETFAGSKVPDYPTRHKYLDTGIKVIGGYAAEKHENYNVNVHTSPEEISKYRKIRDEFENKLLDEETA